MAWKTDTASNNENLIDQIIRFVCGYGTAGTVGYSGTGNGALTLGGTYPSAGTFPTTVTETWTITCTAAAANSGTFSVVGTVSGAQANATVGTPYTNGKIAFTIADGTIDFQVGDAFTITTTQGALSAAGQAWEYKGRASGQTTGGWVEGPGLAGTDSIFVGLQASNNVPGDTYNVQLAGAQGFSSAASWAGQVGKSRDMYMGAWLSSTPFWIVANGQRFVVVAKVSTTYHALYAGKILPYGTPSQYGYPLFIGGSQSANLRWSDTSVQHRTFVDPGSDVSQLDMVGANVSAFLCQPDGAWYTYANWNPQSGNDSKPISGQRFVWPYQAANEGGGAAARQRELRENIDGSFSLMPLILHGNAPSRQVFGELDGCFYVSGFGNAAENIVTIGGVDYLVVQNIFRTNRWNYWALKLA